VLTLLTDVPEPWLVEPSKGVYDFDNLRLADVPEAVAYAEYELGALLLTGSCGEVSAAGATTGQPAKGTQLHLGTPQEPHQVGAGLLWLVCML
jgi:UDP-glucose:glycoprotein glucosyltransferase